MLLVALALLAAWLVSCGASEDGAQQRRGRPGRSAEQGLQTTTTRVGEGAPDARGGSEPSPPPEQDGASGRAALSEDEALDALCTSISSEYDELKQVLDVESRSTSYTEEELEYLRDQIPEIGSAIGEASVAAARAWEGGDPERVAKMVDAFIEGMVRLADSSSLDPNPADIGDASGNLSMALGLMGVATLPLELATDGSLVGPILDDGTMTEAEEAEARSRYRAFLTSWHSTPSCEALASGAQGVPWEQETLLGPYNSLLNLDQGTGLSYVNDLILTAEAVDGPKRRDTWWLSPSEFGSCEGLEAYPSAQVRLIRFEGLAVMLIRAKTDEVADEPGFHDPTTLDRRSSWSFRLDNWIFYASIANPTRITESFRSDGSEGDFLVAMPDVAEDAEQEDRYTDVSTSYWFYDGELAYVGKEGALDEEFSGAYCGAMWAGD